MALRCRATFGFGIGRSVYLLPLPAGSAAITQFVPHTFYTGGHPTRLLNDTTHAGFEVRCQIDLHAAVAGSGTVSVLGSWPGAARQSKRVSLPAGASSVALVLDAAQTKAARLWHPNGQGDQVLYNITATFAPDAGPVATTSRRLGFRHIALVTANDTDPSTHAALAAADGSGQHTMFFRVNGAALYARGANKIPMDLMDGRLTAGERNHFAQTTVLGWQRFHAGGAVSEGHRRLVQSAAEAGFTVMRIWGGGIWEPRAFFDACDEYGVLLYADLMIAAKQNYSLGGRNYRVVVPAELEYQIKRLSHHASIALWDGCNGAPCQNSVHVEQVAAASHLSGCVACRVPARDSGVPW